MRDPHLFAREPIGERNETFKDSGFYIGFEFCEANGGLQLPRRNAVRFGLVIQTTRLDEGYQLASGVKVRGR
jgi:hypothetical protein